MEVAKNLEVARSQNDGRRVNFYSQNKTRSGSERAHSDGMETYCLFVLLCPIPRQITKLWHFVANLGNVKCEF